MAIEQKELEVGGEKIRIESLPAVPAAVLLAKLLKILSGAGKGVVDIPSGSDEVSQAFHLGEMFQGLLAEIDPEPFVNLIVGTIRVSLPAWKDKPSPQFDMWFADRFSRKLDDQVELFVAILQWNYGELVPLLKKKWEAIQHKIALDGSGKDTGQSPASPSAPAA